MEFNSLVLICGCESKFRNRLESMLWRENLLSFAIDNIEDFFEFFQYFPPKEDGFSKAPVFLGNNIWGVTKSLEVLVKVKKEYPFLRVVMVFNGKADQVVKDECIKLGVSGFIDKHTTGEEIRNILQEGRKERKEVLSGGENGR